MHITLDIVLLCDTMLPSHEGSYHLISILEELA